MADQTRRSITAGLLAGLTAAIPVASIAHIYGPALSLLGPTKPLRILILGGTRYVGPALVRAAVGRGHSVTLFNRGHSRPGLFKGLQRVIGDRYPERDSGLTGLTDTWDTVIDLCAYYPRLVEASCEQLGAKVSRYIMMSSISVYEDFGTPGLNEASKTRELNQVFAENPNLEEDEFGSYGARKAACEAVVRKHFPSAHTVVRACGIIGAGIEDDDPNKFYWPARLARDKIIGAPGAGDDPLQVIDVNDVADFLLLSAETGLSGTFNAVGPRQGLTTRDYVETAKVVSRGQARVVWTGVNLQNTPMWAPASIVPGFARISNEKAVAAGLRFRPLKESISANYDWFRLNYRSDFDFVKAGSGPDPAAEASALALALQGARKAADS